MSEDATQHGNMMLITSSLELCKGREAPPRNVHSPMQVLSPSSLAVLGVLALLWIYIFIVRKDPLVLGGRTFRCAIGRLRNCIVAAKLILLEALHPGRATAGCRPLLRATSVTDHSIA